MADNLNVQVLQDDQLAIATVPVEGDILSGTSATDVTALVQTNDGVQLAVKTFNLGGGGGSAKPVYVDSLPETGEEGVLYMVNSGETRDGYAIFQMFSYHENEWVAIGAFDVGIDQNGLLFEHSFDSATNTLTVTKNS